MATDQNTQPANESGISLDRHILAILEPTISLDEMKFDANSEGEGGQKQSRENGTWVPHIRINNFYIPATGVRSFILDCSGFMPIVSFSFDDVERSFKADSIPRDGDVINVRITARQDDTFKDIRADFDITSVHGDGLEKMNPTQIQTYYITGMLKVPTLLAESCFGYSSDTSVEHLKKISADLELGFASNVDAANDAMSRLCPFMSKLNFINDAIDHSYVSDDTFQLGSIDPYYYLNFVDLNKVFNSHNDLEDTLIHMFGIDFNTQPTDTNDLNKLKSQLILTNHENFGGTSQYIVANKIINNASAVSLSSGYQRKLQYFENNSTEKLVSFDIHPLDSKQMKDVEEPMRGRRGEERYKNEVKQKYVGRVDPDNLHPQYFYASMHNQINRNEVHKMKLEVTLETVNHGLYRFMKIPVLIFANDVLENMMGDAVKKVKSNAGFESAGKQFKEDTTSPNNIQKLDEFVSGYYVIDEIRYIYDPFTANSFQQKLTLLRREWPTRLNNYTA